MADHTEQLVGILFRTLSRGGHTEARESLLQSYQSAATTDRMELTEDLFSEIVTVLHEEIDTETEVEILTEAIERLLDRFSTVVEATPVGILVVDEDGRVQLWNSGAERLFGWSESAVRRQRYPDVLTDPAESADQLLPRLRDGKELHGIETQHVHQNGDILDVRLWGAPIQTGDEFGGGVFVLSDITDQKQREQRLAVLNRVLRHNIRTDVNIVQGHLDALADDYPEENEHVRAMEERLSDIVELSDTARNIEQLRADTTAESSPIDVTHTLRERIDRVRAESRRVDITTDIPESCRVVAHDLLPYAFDNILDNAVEHNSAACPQVDVSVSTDASGPRGQVRVRIADDGPGMPASERAVLTAETETDLTHSSGVGLWLTRWIVRSSKGSIEITESEFGGTCVTIRLPQRPEDRGIEATDEATL
jgi:PAS domain S-box-containing protein